MLNSVKAAAFNKTMQIGIVVPDVEAAVRAYEERYGIGGWLILEVGSENAVNVRLRGRPVEWKSKIAVTIVGSVMWELIQPVDPDDLFGQFLAERGGVGGVHHIAVATPDYGRVLEEQSMRGASPILSGTFGFSHPAALCGTGCRGRRPAQDARGRRERSPSPQDAPSKGTARATSQCPAQRRRSRTGDHPRLRRPSRDFETKCP